MTREEMAQACGSATDRHLFPTPESDALLLAAAAELRKTCATCKGWDIGGDGVAAYCAKPDVEIYGMPADGSGFCSFWESQPTGKAQD